MLFPKCMSFICNDLVFTSLVYKEDLHRRGFQVWEDGRGQHESEFVTRLLLENLLGCHKSAWMILVRGFVVCAALACAYRIAIFDLVCYFNLSKVDACTDDDGVDDLSLGMHRHMNGRETYTQCIFHLIILKGTFRLCVLTLTLCLHPSLCVCIPHSVSAHLTLCLHPSLCVFTRELRVRVPWGRFFVSWHTCVEKIVLLSNIVDDIYNGFTYLCTRFNFVFHMFLHARMCFCCHLQCLMTRAFVFGCICKSVDYVGNCYKSLNSH